MKKTLIHILLLSLPIIANGSSYDIPEGSHFKLIENKKIDFVEIEGELFLEGDLALVKNHKTHKVIVAFIPNRKSGSLLPFSSSFIIDIQLDIDDALYEKIIPKNIQQKLKNKQSYSLKAPVSFTANYYSILSQCSYVNYYIGKITNIKIKGKFYEPAIHHKSSSCG